MRIINAYEQACVNGGKKNLSLYAAIAGGCLGLITGGLGSAVGHAVKFGVLTFVIEKIILKKKKKTTEDTSELSLE